MQIYFDVIIPTSDGKLQVIQRTKDTVAEEFDRQPVCVVYRWLDWGYMRVAQKQLKGFMDHAPTYWS